MLISEGIRQKERMIPRKRHEMKTFECYFQKSTRSSGATPIGCTLGAPNESSSLKKQNADL
jgi:hypothetical protein